MPPLATLSGVRKVLIEGSASPGEVLAGCLDRLRETEGGIRAWVTIDVDGALGAARRLDPRLRADQPLWGVPIGVKDTIDVAGLPTTASSRVLAGNTATEDAPVVARLRRAGAVILGKTQTQEFAYGAVTPQTSHPRDPDRIVGGSSGGSAAALAAGHALGALGTDTAGSIRIPSALCGVVGLKPRHGVLPMGGVIPLAPSLDVVGPMALTVEDVAVLWSVLSDTPIDRSHPAGLRVAMVSEACLPELEPEVAAAYRGARDMLLGLGTAVREVQPVAFSAFDVPRSAVLMWEALQVHRSRGWWPARADDYTEETRDYLVHAERSLSPATVDAARAECRILAGRLLAALEGADVIVTPTVPCVAPTRAEAARRAQGSPRRPIVMKLTRIPGPVSVAGLAALSVPCGSGAGGLPIGLQLIGRDEGTVLKVGAAYELAR